VSPSLRTMAVVMMVAVVAGGEHENTV